MLRTKIFLIFFLFSVMIANSVMAVEIPNPLGDGGKDIPTLINTIAVWLLGIGSTIAVIIVIWAAFLFMTSGGNAERVTMARKTLWYAIIGLVVLLLATGVTEFIKNVLSGKF